MPYPDEAVGFLIDGPQTWTEFHKREVKATYLGVPRICSLGIDGQATVV